MTPKWQDERPAHGIVLLKGDSLLCACGQQMELLEKDKGLSQRIRYDILLDRHAAHRKRQTSK